MRSKGQNIDYVALCLLIVFAVVAQGVFLYVADDHLYATKLDSRQIIMSSNMAGEDNVKYDLSFSGQSGGDVGSIRVQFCSNDPFPGQPCDIPIGMDTGQAQLISQTGATGFTVAPETTQNEIVLTRPVSPAPAGMVSFTFDNIVNTTNHGSLYARLETFASTDASGPSVDDGGLALYIGDDPVRIESYVPPYLAFCIGNVISRYDCSTASGDYLDFGELSSNHTSTDQTKMLIATNAEFGYTIRVVGETLTSGIHTIPALTTSDVSRVGTSQFGINLRSNSTPPAGSNPGGRGMGQPTADYNRQDLYKFVSGDVIASHDEPDEYRMYTVNYIVNISDIQRPGIYVTTLNYIALAAF